LTAGLALDVSLARRATRSADILAEVAATCGPVRHGPRAAGTLWRGPPDAPIFRFVCRTRFGAWSLWLVVIAALSSKVAVRRRRSSFIPAGAAAVPRLFSASCH
jgi:hypothetical protein